MNVDDGRVEQMVDLKKMFKTGEEKPEDWEELPDIDQEKIKMLQTKLNRDERRSLIHYLKKNSNVTMKHLYQELRNIRIGVNKYKD